LEKLLALGTSEKKDLAFVTGEQKSDWFVRSGGAPVYPRAELVDEYRRASSRAKLRLMSLHELLRELNVPEAVVLDVITAEAQANNVIQVAGAELPIQAGHAYESSGQRTFDYSMNNGEITLGGGDSLFTLRFSRSGGNSIHFYRSANVPKIARVRQRVLGQALRPEEHDWSSNVYTIDIGDGFLAVNRTGALLQGRVLDVKAEGYGSDHDEVTFRFNITPPHEYSA
jgi:hypothetical protein